MTAGSVAVPTIIPLKAPHGPKHLISSRTPIELHSGSRPYLNCTSLLRPNLNFTSLLSYLLADTNGCVILYAVDGSRPEATFKQGRLHIPNTTFLYKEPFLLPTGKVGHLIHTYH